MSTLEEPCWYCVRTKPKNEKLTAQLLRREDEVEAVFAPHFRYQKATRRGKVWFVEPMFPGYLLVKFALHPTLRLVLATGGATSVVRFGDDFATLDESILEKLRSEFADDEVRTIEEEITAGEELIVTGGAMKGIEAIVTQVISGTDRVRILMDLLGETREVEIKMSDIGRAHRLQK